MKRTRKARSEPAQVDPTPAPSTPPVGSNGKPATNGHPATTPLAKPVDAVLNRVREVLDHSEEWRTRRRQDVKDIAKRRAKKASDKNILKAQFAAATKELDALDGELLAAVRDMDEPYPPTMPDLYPEPEAEAKPKAADASKQAPATDRPGCQGWRDVPLAELGIPAGILAKLAEPVDRKRGALPPIRTLGELTDFQEPRDGWEPRLTDLKGLGKGAVDKITEATQAYWSKRAGRPMDAAADQRKAA